LSGRPKASGGAGGATGAFVTAVDAALGAGFARPPRLPEPREEKVAALELIGPVRCAGLLAVEAGAITIALLVAGRGITSGCGALLAATGVAATGTEGTRMPWLGRLSGGADTPRPPSDANAAAPPIERTATPMPTMTKVPVRRPVGIGV
jgi:hypothetical protein